LDRRRENHIPKGGTGSGDFQDPSAELKNNNFPIDKNWNSVSQNSFLTFSEEKSRTKVCGGRLQRRGAKQFEPDLSVGIRSHGEMQQTYQ
jgi:hypothetical protein